ncbi:MAG: hypothetical protein U1F16_17520 [Turneriella sp.]
MQEIDIVYQQDEYNKNGVIIRQDEVVTYWLGPRDQGAANGFAIGAFLENPPDYVPSSVVRQVAHIVASWGDAGKARIEAERQGEREKIRAQELQQREERRRVAADESRRRSVWEMPDPWRGTAAKADKPWWKFW